MNSLFVGGSCGHVGIEYEGIGNVGIWNVSIGYIGLGMGKKLERFGLGEIWADSL